MKYLSLITSIILTCSAWSSAPPYDEWKAEAVGTYKLSDGEVALVAPRIKSADDWKQIKWLYFQVQPTFPGLAEVRAAAEAEMKIIDDGVDACRQNLEETLAKCADLFSAEMSHPTKQNFEDFKTAVLEVIVDNLKINLRVADEVASIYSLPYSIGSRDRTYKQKISTLILNERSHPPESEDGPIFQILKINNVEEKFTGITRAILTAVVPELIESGRSGPYLSDCRDIWDAYSKRMLAFRDHCQFFYRLEKEIVIWSFNSMEPDGAVNKEDYLGLSAYWSLPFMEATTSSEFYEKIVGGFWLAQTTLLAELYLRGFSANDFTEMLTGKASTSEPSWLNILSIAKVYLATPGIRFGLYDYPHPDMMKNAMKGCLDIYFTKEVASRTKQLQTFIPDAVKTTAQMAPREHLDSEIMPLFINKLMAKLVNLNVNITSNVMRKAEGNKKDELAEIIAAFRSNFDFYAEFTSTMKILFDYFLASYDINEKRFVNPIGDDDKEMYFQALDLLEVYLPYFNHFMRVLENKLDVK